MKFPLMPVLYYLAFGVVYCGYVIYNLRGVFASQLKINVPPRILLKMRIGIASMLATALCGALVGWPFLLILETLNQLYKNTEKDADEARMMLDSEEPVVSFENSSGQEIKIKGNGRWDDLKDDYYDLYAQTFVALEHAARKEVGDDPKLLGTKMGEWIIEGTVRKHVLGNLTFGEPEQIMALNDCCDRLEEVCPCTKCSDKRGVKAAS